jgi:hypothetical protein
MSKTQGQVVETYFTSLLSGKRRPGKNPLARASGEPVVKGRPQQVRISLDKVFHKPYIVGVEEHRGTRCWPDARFVKVVLRRSMAAKKKAKAKAKKKR